MGLTGQSRLKRRLAGASFSTSSPQGRPVTSDDFDIPLLEADPNASVKRRKLDDGPQKNKKAAKRKNPVVDKGQNKKDKDGVKPITSSKTHTTVDVSKPKRAPKTPVYVDESDGGDQEDEGTNSHDEAARDESDNHQADSDIVQDSYALNKAAVEAALEASTHSFNSNLEEIVCPVPNVGTNKGMNEAPAEMHKGADSTGTKFSLAKTKTPPRAISSVKEPWMPAVVKEKIWRKTPIVHFGPGGPDNQAVLHKQPRERSSSRDHSRDIDQVGNDREDQRDFDQDFNDIGVDTVSQYLPVGELSKNTARIPTPPRAQERISLPRGVNQASVSRPIAQHAVTEQLAPQKRGETVKKAVVGGPVRTKRILTETISRPPTESEQPPATPVSFLARVQNDNLPLHGLAALGNKADVFVDHDMAHTSGDASTTLLNENPVDLQKVSSYRSRRMRHQQSVSTDLSSQEGSPTSRKEPKDTVQEPIYSLEGIRETQHSLVDSILLITKVRVSDPLKLFANH